MFIPGISPGLGEAVADGIGIFICGEGEGVAVGICMPGIWTWAGVGEGFVMVPPVEAGGTGVADADGLGDGLAFGGSFVVGMWP